MILAVLAVVTVTFSPPAPTVGDAITLDFAAPVTLDPSSAYEIVSQSHARVVVRTFTPKPLVLSGTSAGTRFANLVIPVRSVLKPNDDLKPAPLTPPRALPYTRLPFIAIAIAALLAIVAWTLAWRRAESAVREVVPALPPEERFRRAVLSLRSDKRRPHRWAALADETRLFLAATRPRLGSELTTSEIVPRLQEHERVVEEILRQGDLEKFSPWGAEARDFDDVARRVLDCVLPSEVEGPGREEAA